MMTDYNCYRFVTLNSSLVGFLFENQIVKRIKLHIDYFCNKV